MNFNGITKAIGSQAIHVGRVLAKHAPTILTIGGVTGVVVSTVMACKATHKLDVTAADIHDDVLKTKTEHMVLTVDANDEKVSVRDEVYSKEITRAYLRAAWKMTKLYAPSVLIGAASIASILTGKHIMDRRYSACLAACTTTERLFNEYRRRVKEELGEEADHKFRFGLKDIVEEVPILDAKGNPKTDKNGDVKTKKETRQVMNDMGASEYARIFDEISSLEWNKNVDYNKNNLMCKEAVATRMLQSRGYLFLNEVYEMLGLKLTPQGQDVGWIYMTDNPYGDNTVSFGMHDKIRVNGELISHMDMMTGSSNAILLDFNCQGYIKDKLVQAQTRFDYPDEGDDLWDRR